MICGKCDGTGKLTIDKPVSMTEMETVEVDCDVCGGTGELQEDPTPAILSRLDRIIELLERIAGGKYAQ
jgi:excinuclease UvrABC ATPase subunit